MVPCHCHPLLCLSPLRHSRLGLPPPAVAAAAAAIAAAAAAVAAAAVGSLGDGGTRSNESSRVGSRG